MKRLAPAAFSGLLLALAFPPFNLMLLAYVALVPFLFSLEGCGYWKGFRRGYVMGLVFALPNMVWLQQFVGRWTQSFWMGAVPWLAVCLAFAVYYGFLGGAAAKALNRGWFWAIPLIWAGAEVLRSVMPYLFFPWSLLAASQWKLPAFIQSAWFGGPYFVSAWVCLASVVVYLMWRGSAKGIVVWRLAILWVLILGVSVSAYLQPETGNIKTLAAIQPGVDMAFQPKYEQDAQLAVNVPKAIAIGSGVKRDLVVLPEGIAEWGVGRDAPTASFPLNFADPTVLGGQRGDTVRYQSAFAFDGKWQHADKVRLVIFGEYVPFRDSLKFLQSFDLPGGVFRAGTEVRTLDVGGTRVGALLCFEALFEEVARKHAKNGAEVLAILSLDDWYQNTGAIDALRAGAVLRAIENHIPVVRSAPLGPSMIISSRGIVVAETLAGKLDVAQAQVRAEAHEPIAARAGFRWLALGVLIIVTIWWKRLPTAAATATKAAAAKSTATKP